MTYRITSQLPFPGHLARVPDYASQHHEKPDGSGYPDGIKGKDLPLQSRILAVADIFDALTARDRPYKKPMSLSRAIEIMQNMKKHNHLDPDIVDIFLDSEIYRAYAEKHLDKNQIDA
jgi:HD-GYP domain-containing protein (c-di-GMP phosphodiesterase class II)